VSSFMSQLLHRNTISAGSSSRALVPATVGRALSRSLSGPTPQLG
jgi:hypothetical protein